MEIASDDAQSADADAQPQAEDHAFRDSGIQGHRKTVDEVDPATREEFERKSFVSK